MKKLEHPAISACSVCGQPADEPCIGIKSGKELKYFHQGGRVLVLQVLTAKEI